MKNILILHNSLDYSKSGVEKVSFLLKKELTSRGYNCFEGCITGENTNHLENVFIYNFNDSREKVLSDLAIYIKKNKINVVINQGFFDSNINNALSHLKKNKMCKIVFCLHNAPSAYLRKASFSVLERIKILVWYFLKFNTVIFNYNKYRLNMLAEMFGIADKFILLSNSYTEELCNTLKIQDIKKICSINNPLAYQAPHIDFSKKKKQVLILGRLDDFQKNISSALRIWKSIENADFNNWHLTIVGSGIDEDKLKKYAKELDLKNTSFVGATPSPETYYQESSIFMMTSHIEGWPMTLLEAQQYGCIPIAFNSFGALQEIVENGTNGYIVENNNESAFAQKIIELMSDTNLRQKISQNCTNVSKNFSSAVIGDKWDFLLHNL